MSEVTQTRPRSGFPPWPWMWLGVTALVLVLDRYSKALVDEALELYRPQQVFRWLNITLAHNYGAAFSFLSNAGGWQRWLFVVLATAVSLVILVWLLRLPRRDWVTGLALSLVLGGAVGNLADRVKFGYVIDFVDVHFGNWHYPAFNVADSAITCGVILLLLEALWFSRRRKVAEP